MLSFARARLVLLALLPVLLGSSAAWAQEVGAGRVSILPGWRLTPNDTFARAAAAAGHPLTQTSKGGPALMASFGYGAVEHLEIAIDLFGGAEELALAGEPVLRSISYGALLGVRTQPELFPGFSVSVSVETGAVLINVSGGLANQQTERLAQGWAGELGVHYRVSELVTLGLEYRLILARGIVAGVGSINGGGSWLALAISFRTAPAESPSSVNFR